MDFFCNCKTEQERKDLYRQLSKCFHPDKNGTDYLMCELNKQYSNPIQRESFHQKIMGNHIAFDHPIHEEIRREKKKNEYLEHELKLKEQSILHLRNFQSFTDKQNIELRSQIKSFEIEKEDLYKIISEVNKKDIKSKKKIERMEFVLLFLGIILILTNI